MALPPLSQIADFRGRSAPLTFAVDPKSKPGVAVLHQVIIDTVEVPVEQLKQPGVLNVVSACDEPRLIWLAYAMAGAQNEQVALRLRRLLELMSMLDPTGGPERHEEWPLKLVGAEAETNELMQVLNELAQLTGYKPGA